MAVHVRFGTDGIRGVANVDLTPDVALAVGRAVAEVLPAPEVVVGRDTRRSGAMLQAAVTAGLASRGVDVVDLGVLPTPAVAWAAAQRQVPAVVVSASHNPYADNGLKVFGPGGHKLGDADERAIEAVVAGALAAAGSAGDGDWRTTGHGEARGSGSVLGARRGALAGSGALVPGGSAGRSGTGVGKVVADPRVAESYVSAVVAALEGRDLGGTAVVVDCAHGAAWQVAPDTLRRLGADVTVLGAAPDGTNINAGCGSTCPEALAEMVVTRGAALGLALDGDADRLVAVDHQGRVVSGDHLLALFAADLRSRGALAGETVVVTVMSNLGLRLALASQGIAVHETPVGDRYVLEALDAGGYVLGGEQSGHLVFRSLATTGDGLLTGVLLADLVRRSGTSLAVLADQAMTEVPQHLLNVRAADPRSVAEQSAVTDAVARASQLLGDRGRVLVRASGTEPLVRIMVEAVDAAVADQVLADLRAVVEAAASSPSTAPAPTS